MNKKIVCISIIAFLFSQKVAWSQDADALQQLRELQQTQRTQLQQIREKQLEQAGSSKITADQDPETAEKSPTELSAKELAEKLPPGVQLPSTDEIIDEAAFQSVLKDIMPLTPNRIIRVRKKYSETELASNTEPSAPPRPVATSQLVNLAPGSTPPVIRLSQGFVTSLVFIDSTGAEWPIEAYDLGNPKAFNIQWDRKSNTLMIQATKMYTYGNLAVRLYKLSTPVMITLVPGQKAVDYRVDLRIQGIGPNATDFPTTSGLPADANSLLLSILDGVAPANGKKLRISGGDGEAWIYDNKLYVRTVLNVLSPGWIATMSSADGMHVYEMQKTPVLLVSHHGKLMQIKVEGF